MPRRYSPRKHIIFPDGGIPLDVCTTFLQRKRIAVLNEHNGDVNAAADALGIHPQSIYDILHRFSRRGVIKTEASCPLNGRLRKYEIRMGNLKGTISQQEYAVRKWVADNVPDDGTIIDLMWAVIADLAHEDGYFDDTEQEEEAA